MKNKKTNPLIMIPLCIIFGILDYYVCDLAVYVLKLPIFCDTIFCLAMTFFTNPLYGILVVVFDHIYDALLSGQFVIFQLYMICAFAGCLTAWVFKQYIMKDDDSHLLIAGKLFQLSIIMCLVMSITGGIISRICAYLMGEHGEYTYQIQFLKVLLGDNIISPLIDAILLRVPVNIVDRLVTVFASWGVFRLMEMLPIWKEEQ